MTKVFWVAIISCISVLLCGCNSVSDNNSGNGVTVCVDSGTIQIVDQIKDAWKVLHPDMTLSVVEIPSSADSAEIKIKELRTEIMAGNGPDVFFLQCPDPDTKDVPVLFSNPEKAMYQDLFLPLDEWLNSSEVIQTEVWNQEVLNTGNNADGQMIIPFTYEYEVIAADHSLLPERGSIFCYENTRDTNTTLLSALASRSFEFQNQFPALADYSSGKLLINKEDVEDRFLQVSELEASGLQPENTGSAVVAGAIGDSILSRVSALPSETTGIIGYTFSENKVNAYVTSYVAVNANIPDKDAVYSLLDMLYDQQFLAGGTCTADHINYRLDNAYLTSGILISDTLSDRYPLLSEKLLENLHGIQDAISVVRFYSELDCELNNFYLSCQGQPESACDSQIDKLISAMEQMVEE